MEKNVKSLAVSIVALMVLLALIAPVQAPYGLCGTVYNPDGTPAEGVLVTATNINTSSSDSNRTNVLGFYYIPLSFGPGNHVKIVATRGNLYAETTVVCTGDQLRLDLTLQAAAAPAFTPIGLIALIGVLSVIAVLTMRRKRR